MLVSSAGRQKTTAWLLAIGGGDLDERDMCCGLEVTGKFPESTWWGR
ncbi:MAG TPA: hypothetical protein PLU94_10390 [Methanoregulaceae archaeon]|nr:hypothetical protein [Methanoregulaceae archaeon]